MARTDKTLAWTVAVFEGGKTRYKFETASVLLASGLSRSINSWASRSYCAQVARREGYRVVTRRNQAGA